MTWKAVLLWSLIIISSVMTLGYDPQQPMHHPLYGKSHPDLELYYQQRRSAEATVPATRPQGYTTFNVMPTSAKGEPLQGTEIVSAFADLGGTLGALGFASWLCVYLLRLHDSERQQMRKAFTEERSRVQDEREKEREAFATERNLHLSKDSDNDAAMRESMQRSQEQLLQIVESNQRQVSDLKEIMSTHSQDLKAIMLEMKLAVSGGFEKLHERWDGTERRSGNAKSSASRRGSA